MKTERVARPRQHLMCYVKSLDFIVKSYGKLPKGLQLERVDHFGDSSGCKVKNSGEDTRLKGGNEEIKQSLCLAGG